MIISMIYMDNAATTPVHPKVLEAMMPYFNVRYANPSGNYEFARKIRKDVENARSIIAGTLGARPEEIYFTSGGTEGDNWAVKAAAFDRGHGHIISTNVEHKAMLNTLEWIESQGFEKDLAEADGSGIVAPDKIRRLIKNDTFMVSVMAANNEIGTIMPLKDIARSNNLRKRGIIFHTDAVQAYGHIYLNVNDLGVDMLSASAHKFRGPKGAGFIYIRRDTIETSLIHGGSQEMGMRAGTENVASIIGMAKAAQICMETINERRMKETQLRNYMIDRILRTFKGTVLNGTLDNRLPNNINIYFPGINGYSLVSALDRFGVCASAGSACSSASSKPSHVLKAIGLTDQQARNCVRFTLCEDTTAQDVDYLIETLYKIIKV